MLMLAAGAAGCAHHDPPTRRGTVTAYSGIAGHHPDSRFEVREIVPTDTIWLRPLPPADDTALRAMLTVPPDAVTFTGADSGADALGAVDAAAPLPDGRLVVLDAAAGVVRIVSAAGHQTGTIGRAGRGPGDLYQPQSLATDAAGNVYIGDLLRRAQRFRPDGTGFVLDTVLPLTVSPLGLCVLDTLLIVHGLNVDDSSAIKVYTTHGIAVRQFGMGYRSPSQIINHEFNRGRIACLPAARRIGWLAGGRKVLREFTPDGRTVRLTVLADARRSDVVELPNEGYRMEPGDAWDHVESLVALPSGALLLQVGTSTTESQKAHEDYAALVSILLPAGPGSPQALTTGGQRVIAMLGARPVFVTSDPMPSARWAR